MPNASPLSDIDIARLDGKRAPKPDDSAEYIHLLTMAIPALASGESAVGARCKLVLSEGETRPAVKRSTKRALAKLGYGVEFARTRGSELFLTVTPATVVPTDAPPKAKRGRKPKGATV